MCMPERDFSTKSKFSQAQSKKKNKQASWNLLEKAGKKKFFDDMLLDLIFVFMCSIIVIEND